MYNDEGRIVSLFHPVADEKLHSIGVVYIRVVCSIHALHTADICYDIILLRCRRCCDSYAVVSVFGAVTVFP